MICPQNIFFNLTAIVKFTPSVVIGWNKSRSAMRTCVAYEIELLLSVVSYCVSIREGNI